MNVNVNIISKNENMENIKISAVIITLNEEKNIQKCMDSLKDVADEIVVVDSFSTDKTEEICKNYHSVKFLQHKFEGYGQQKNWGNKQCAYDYILSLDADESLSEELKNAILKIKENWQYDVYSVNRLTCFMGRKLTHCLYPDRQLRLFDRRKTQWNENRVHEKIILTKDITRKHINHDILHFANQNIDALMDTLNKYSTLKAQHSFDAGKKPSIAKMIFSPIWAFIRTYILKMGFLDGVSGFVTCVNMAHYRFLKYAKLIELHKTNKESSPLK